MKKILIIDDDEIILLLLSNLLKKSGYEVFTATDGISGLIIVKHHNPDLVITDFKMPGMSGIEVVQKLAKSNPGVPVILLTAHGDVSITIKSIQAGAYDYIEKPIQPKELLEVIKNGIQSSIQSRSLSETISFPARKAIEENLLVGKNPAMREIFKNVGRISLNKMSVLITGETGTGKEQVARLIHYSGVTRDCPMIVINCNALNEDELEMELFGYGKGTSEISKKDRPGKLEQAGEGTIMLDEFTTLPHHIQLKLLRVIQDMEIMKIGSDQPVKFQARIIATSSRNLEQLVSTGMLLKELYYNLKVFTIALPPLRQRLDDIPELLNQLVQKLNRKLNKNIVKVEGGILDILKKYNWPGNVRELENVLTQAVLLSRGDVLDKDHIHVDIRERVHAATHTKQLSTLADVEKEHIDYVLTAVSWSKLEASRILEITRPTLNSKIEKYNLKKP